MLEKIWIKRFKKGPMDSVRSAQLIAGKGIATNANIGGKRQVTILSAECWSTVMRDLGIDFDPSERRANLLISEIELANTRGKILQIGACRIRIHGELRPCERMDEVFAGLKDRLKRDWAGGVYGEVLDDGVIQVGDATRWLD